MAAQIKDSASRDDREMWIYRLSGQRDGDGCRDWPWAKNNKGYGVIRWEGPMVKVGHVILDLSGRPRPEGAMMLHSCDRPSCVAPWHLSWGSALDNRHDADHRGRARPAPGDQNGQSKLTEDNVRLIRSSGRTAASLAEEFGVHRSVVAKVRRGETWRQVKEDA